MMHFRQQKICFVLILFIISIIGISACRSAEEDAKSKLGERSIAFTESGFFQSVRSGDAEAVRLFLEAGMPPDVKLKRETALTVAANRDNLEIVKLLINADAEVNVITDIMDRGFSPLSRAVIKNNLDIVTVLLEAGADPNLGGHDEGEYLVKTAIKNSNRDMVNSLLSFGANIDPHILHEVEIKDASVLDALIEAGADLEARDAEGKTPLMTAALSNWESTVKILIQAGADVNAEKDGYTALTQFFNIPNPNIIEPLLLAGAKPTAKDLEFAKYTSESFYEALLGAAPAEARYAKEGGNEIGADRGNPNDTSNDGFVIDDNFRTLLIEGELSGVPYGIGDSAQDIAHDLGSPEESSITEQFSFFDYDQYYQYGEITYLISGDVVSGIAVQINNELSGKDFMSQFPEEEYPDAGYSGEYFNNFYYIEDKYTLVVASSLDDENTNVDYLILTKD